MRPTKNPLLNTLAFLGQSGPVLVYTALSRHLINVPTIPKPHEPPFDPQKLAAEFKFHELPILNSSCSDEALTEFLEFKRKPRSPFARPSQHFRRLGPKPNRRIRY